MHKLKNLQQEAAHIRLTSAEKSAMRAHIFGAPSPVQVEKSPYVFLSAFSYHTRMALAGVMLFVLVGAGTSSAAQGSLPGDLLYGIKLSVNEKVEEALAPTASAKAEVQVALAERRIEEAQTLAAEGRLEPEVAEALAVRFDAHAEMAQVIADTVDEREPGTALQVKTKLASSFAANGAVLKKLGKGSSNQNTKEQSDVLGTRVIARGEGPAKVAMQARSFAATALKVESPAAPAPATDPVQTGGMGGGVETMSMTADSAVQVDTAAQKRAGALQKKAAESLADVREALKQWKGDAETVERVGKELAAADTHMSAGATLAGEGAFAAASEEFAAALTLSVRLEALLKADQKFNSGILKELINAAEGEVQGVQVEILIPELEAR